jgi:SAM-dependent methyltransferase
MIAGTDWTGYVGDVWADEWRRTDRSFANLTDQLEAAILAAAPPGPFRALDIGCGAGATSLALAIARPGAEVVGVDLSQSLVDVARNRLAGLSNCRVEQGDVLVAAAAIRPDLLVSRHGVMFFADPVAAFTALRAAAAPGATLIFSCFGPRRVNRFATLVDELVPPEPAAADEPGPFAFADPERVADILTRAGWVPDAPRRVPFAYRAGAGDDPVADAVSFLSRIGPAAAALREASEPDALRLALASALAHYRTVDAVDLPALGWIWRAQAGEPA